MSFFQALPPRSFGGLGLLFDDETHPTVATVGGSPALATNHPRSSFSPVTTTLERYKSAILRVWGTLTVSQPKHGDSVADDKPEYIVHIQSHDDSENIDLLQPGWHLFRQTIDYAPVTFAEARRHDRYLLNRLSVYNDWRPIVRVVRCPVETDPGITSSVPVCFCLFDKTHMPGVLRDETDAIIEGDDLHNGKVSDTAMVAGFNRYIARLKGEIPEETPSPSQTLAASAGGQPEGRSSDLHPAPIPRGRRRRQLRRHGHIAPQTSMKGESRIASSPAPQQDEGLVMPVRPKPAVVGAVVRGRKRRQFKRHGLGLHQVEASPSIPIYSHAKTAVDAEEDVAVNTGARLNPEMLPTLPGGTRLGPEAFSALVDKQPVIWLKTPKPEEFDSELLVLPIHYDNGDKRMLGYLVLPKESIRVWVNESWVNHMSSNGTDFWVERLFVLDRSSTSSPRQIARYWDKFLPEVVDEFIDGLWPAALAKDRVGDVELALRTSLQTPPLVFPDLELRAVASTKEHLKIWSALDTDLDDVRGLDTSRFLDWNMKLSNDWRDQRNEELQNLLDKGLGAIVEGSASPESGVDYAKEQLFYGSRYFGAISVVFQEQTFKSIARIAADERNNIAPGAHATLQLGLCFLSGFGVDRDIRKGLKLVLEAANKGDPRAQAVTGRLSVSFGSYSIRTPLDWVIEQARDRSYWAIEELGRVSQRLYSETVGSAVFLAATFVGRVGHGEDSLEELVESRFDLFDPSALEEQIKKEFGPVASRTRVTALDQPIRPFDSPSSSRSSGQAWPEPPQGFRAFTDGGGDALGLMGPGSQPEPPQALESAGFDDETDALGLFGPSVKHETHHTAETPLASPGARFVSESPVTWGEEAGKNNLLGVFTTDVTGGDLVQPRGASAGEAVSSPTPETPGEAGEEINEASAFGLFVPATGADALGLLTPAVGADSPTLGAPSRDFALSPTRDTDSPDSYPLQHEQAMRGRPNADGASQVGGETQLQPSAFFDIAMRFVCCYGISETLPVLLREQPRLAPNIAPETYIPMALAAGQGEIALALLESEIEVTKETNPYLLFQLHHLPPQQVDPVARAIVARGFDPNEKVELYRDSRFFSDCFSVFLEMVLHHRMSHSHNPFRHWLPEIRGRSLTPLRWAIYHGNEHVAKALLDLGAEFARLPDVDRCVTHGGPVDRLETAAFTVPVLEEPCLNLNILEMFFQRHGDHQPRRAVFAETPLGLIAMEPDSPERRLRFSGRGGEKDNLERVLSLLRRHQPDSDAQLFWAAAMNGHEDIVRYLIKSGVDIELRYNGQTPLHTAVLHGQKGVFDLLVKNGADVRALTSERGMSMIDLLLWKPKPVDTELYLIDQLYQLLGSVSGGNGEFGRKVQPIHLAALNSRVAALERLMELGADPTVPIEEDIMPWIRGCFRHEGWEPPETLKRDRANEGNLLATPVSIKGLTPAGVILARYDIMPPKDLLAMLRILVLSTSSPITLSRLYTRPSLRQTVFHLLACHFPLTETGIIENLLDGLAQHLSSGPDEVNGIDHKALINLPDADGDTPLHYAALFSGSHNTRAIDRLLSLGADPTARNRFGMTPGVMRARYLTWKGAAAAAAAEDAALRSAAGRGGGHARGSFGDGGKWGSKLVQLGIPLSPKERFAGLVDDSSSGEADPGVQWSTRYWGGRTASCMRLHELSGETGEPDGIKMMGQLLRGARVREVWDLHAGRWVTFEREMMVQLVTEADMMVDFGREGRI